jgi:predicted cupin superfamily sugar epimerase
MWHFYAGDALEVFELLDTGKLICTRIGPDIMNGEVFQYVVKANTWFASRVAAGGEFSLVGCTVAPGFYFADSSLADRTELMQRFPEHQQLIASLTRL